MPRRIKVGLGVVLVCCGCSLDARELAVSKGGDPVDAGDTQTASDGSVDRSAADGSSYAQTELTVATGGPAAGDARPGSDDALDASRAEDGSQVQVDQGAKGGDVETIDTTPNEGALEANATSVPNTPEPNIVDSGVGDAGGGSARADDAAGDVPSDAVATDSGNGDGAASLVDCGSPAKPSDGEVNAPLTIVGSLALYTCNEGYSLPNSAIRMCQSDGSWSGPPVTCAPKDCGTLVTPTNGAVQTARTTYGAEAKYTCLDGYNFSGSTSRTCQADGKWSGTAGTCAPKDCGGLPNPENGTVSTTATTYAGTATYACDNGYVLSGTSSRKCEAGGTWGGTAPICTRPSCAGGGTGAGFNCGAAGTDDCCASPLVDGGTFNRDNNTSYPAAVSSFRLDKYEITVGRFRAFVGAGMGTQANPPASGSGANPNVAGSGWDPAWNASLEPTTADLTGAVQCSASDQTWTGNDDRRPMTCITWCEAFAFCVWEGGRLPTELEWNYAAAGGSEQRKYPWGGTEPGTNTDLAVFGFRGRSCSGVACIGPVGSAAGGNGKWGQADLAGNVWERNLDWYASSYPSSCTNCANAASASYRVLRGGSYRSDASYLLSSYRGYLTPSFRGGDVGARCARSP